MSVDEVPITTVLEIIKVYLIDQPDKFNYVPVIEALNQTYGLLRKFGVDEDEFTPFIHPIIQMIEENVRAKKIAADAQRLITEFKTLLAAKEDAYIKRVEGLLDENIQSGNTGTRMLALTLLNKMKAMKD